MLWKTIPYLLLFCATSTCVDCDWNAKEIAPDGQVKASASHNSFTPRVFVDGQISRNVIRKQAPDVLTETPNKSLTDESKTQQIPSLADLGEIELHRDIPNIANDGAKLSKTELTLHTEDAKLSFGRNNRNTGVTGAGRPVTGTHVENSTLDLGIIHPSGWPALFETHVSQPRNDTTPSPSSEGSGLPGWALTLIGSVGATFTLLMCTKGVEWVFTPSKAIPTEEEKLEAELKNVRGRAEELSKALEDMQEEKRKEEKKNNEEQNPIAEEETKKDEAASAAPSHDELVGEMLYRTREVDKQIVQGTIGTIQQISPLIGRAQAVQDVVRSNIASAQNKVETMVRDEVLGLVDKVQETLGQPKVETPQWLLDFQAGVNSGDTKLPPVGLLVAGILAPAQLRSIKSTCLLNLLFNGSFFVSGVVVAIIDWYKPCDDDLVWIWVLGLLGQSLVLFFADSVNKGRAAGAVAQLEEDAKKVTFEGTGNPIMDAFESIVAGNGYYFKALSVYDRITHSWLYSITKLYLVLYLGWGGFGLWITIHMVIEDHLHCSAKAVVFYCHFSSFFYLMFLTWSIVGFVFWLIPVIASCRFVKYTILKVAKDLDDASPIKLPIFMTLVKALVLRGSSDLIRAHKQELQREVIELEKENQACQAKIEKMRREVEQVEKEEMEALSKEEKLIELYEKQMKDSLDALRPSVQFVASLQDAGLDSFVADATATANRLNEGVNDILADPSTIAARQQLSAQAQAASSALQGHATAAADALKARMEEHAPALESIKNRVGDLQQQVGDAAKKASDNISASVGNQAGASSTSQGK